MEKKSQVNQENVIFPILLFFGIFAVMLIAFAPRDTRIEPRPTQVAVAQVPTQPVAQPTPRDHLELMASGLETVLASDVRAGGRLYGSACAACHGINLQGISGLGKTLINSEFVNRLNDDELVAFITVGRATSDPLNTTGVAMPAKGGNPSLTDENLHEIVDYIRSFNGATVENDLAEETPFVYEEREFVPFDLSAINAPSDNTDNPESTETPAPTQVVATPESVEVVEVAPAPVGSPEQLYAWYCSQCHGLDGTGNPMMPNSALVGMPIDKDMLFTTFTQPLPLDGQFHHAYRGGYIELTDDQLNALLDYVVTLSASTDSTQAPIEEPSAEIPVASVDLTQAQQDYGWACSQCHGANGEGSPTVMNSALIGLTINDEAVFTLLTTPPAFGEVVVHAYRGGYPEMSDEQIRNLILYIKQLAGE
ncbi:MAG: c-type cytochrome [Anaerolineae bacterium]|nr:c-type cytochrome [Anaerolineae bacterium]